MYYFVLYKIITFKFSRIGVTSVESEIAFRTEFVDKLSIPVDFQVVTLSLVFLLNE